MWVMRASIVGWRVQYLFEQRAVGACPASRTHSGLLSDRIRCAGRQFFFLGERPRLRHALLTLYVTPY